MKYALFYLPLFVTASTNMAVLTIGAGSAMANSHVSTRSVRSARNVKTLTLSDSDIAPVHTAVGYTTLLQFESRPGQVIVGDQDAFKVEYAGNSLAIKPLLFRASTDLFVMTDNDRFNFKLISGPTTDADYIVRVTRTGSSPESYPVQVLKPATQGNPARLIRKKIARRSQCSGLELRVQEIAWPESESSYLVQFEASVSRKLLRNAPLQFKPGDFEIRQGPNEIPIESLYLQQLQFTQKAPHVSGTLVLRQADLTKGSALRLSFLPEFLKSRSRSCPAVFFSRAEARRPKSPPPVAFP